MKITLKQLEQLGACVPQREKFSELFPTGEVKVTRELCETYAEVFDFEWAAENLLSAAADAEWLKACKARDAAETEWLKACKAHDAAAAEWRKARAIAFADAYNQSH